MQLYAELTELTLGPGEPVTQRHLLVSPETDADTPRQASTLLTAAVKEGEGGGEGGASLSEKAQQSKIIFKYLIYMRAMALVVGL